MKKIVINKFILLICFPILFSIGCGGPKKPVLKEMSDLLMKPKKTYTRTSGNFVIENRNDQEMQILEIYADVKINGKSVGSFIKKTDAVISPNNSISIGFYNETNNELIGELTNSVELSLKGYFKARVNEENVSNSFDYVKSIVPGVKSEITDDPINSESNKKMLKEQKKIEKQMKKNEKDKRKMQNQVES